MSTTTKVFRKYEKALSSDLKVVIYAFFFDLVTDKQ